MFSCTDATCGAVQWCGKDNYGVTEAKLDMTKLSRESKPAVSFAEHAEAAEKERQLRYKAERGHGFGEEPLNDSIETHAEEAPSNKGKNNVDLGALGISEVTLEFPDQPSKHRDGDAAPLTVVDLAALGISEVVLGDGHEPKVCCSIAEDEEERKRKEEEEAAEIAAADAETARMAREEAARQQKAKDEAQKMSKELSQPGRLRDEKDDDAEKSAAVVEAAIQKARAEEEQIARQEFLDANGFDSIDDLQPGGCCWKQRTPLHLAAASGNADMVRHLIAGKADVTKRDSWGMTPLETARWSQRSSAEVTNALKSAELAGS